MRVSPPTTAIRCPAHAPRSRSAECGFTFIELLVALAIVGAMAISVGYAVSQRFQDSKGQVALIALSHDMPKALFAYLKTSSVPPNGTRIEDEMASFGIRATTPWGRRWHATVRGGRYNAEVRVAYPIGGDNPYEIAQRIAERLDNPEVYPQISFARAERPNRYWVVVHYPLFSDT